MKILMPNHFPLQGSGSGIYTLNVALELLRAGHEVMVIVPDHQPVDEYPFETKTILFSNGDNLTGRVGIQLPLFHNPSTQYNNILRTDRCRNAGLYTGLAKAYQCSCLSVRTRCYPCPSRMGNSFRRL